VDIAGAGEPAIGVAWGARRPELYRTTRLLFANVQYAAGLMSDEAHRTELENARAIAPTLQRLGASDSAYARWLGWLIEIGDSFQSFRPRLP
jgi:hypothetical protein